MLVRDKISENVFLSCIEESKFKSDRITVSLITPLDRSEVTTNALIPFVLRKGCSKYPDFTLLNRKLANMYGAVLDSDVSKRGDLQIIEVSIQYLDDRFCIDGENISAEAAGLISDIVFSPCLDDNGLFKAEDVEIEKAGLIDTIKSDLNDKRVYALTKMFSMIFEGERFGIKKYGYLDDVCDITPEKLTAAWKKLISTSRIEIMCTGKSDTKEIRRVFEEKLSEVERNPVDYERSEPLPYSEYKEAEEAMKIVQGKLVMAFRTGAPKTEKEKNAMRIFSALYGGTPFSKLFMNVREKMSLCYYASSHFERALGIVIVDSGIEFENRQAAQNEILNQLEEVKNGNFTQEEIDNTILIIKNIIGSVGDSLTGLEDWYMNEIIDGTMITPEDDINNISEITKEDIVAAAEKLRLTTVFFLKGEEK